VSFCPTVHGKDCSCLYAGAVAAVFCSVLLAAVAPLNGLAWLIQLLLSLGERAGNSSSGCVAWFWGGRAAWQLGSRRVCCSFCKYVYSASWQDFTQQ
jgi:hypothetical protein